MESQYTWHESLKKVPKEAEPSQADREREGGGGIERWGTVWFKNMEEYEASNTINDLRVVEGAKWIGKKQMTMVESRTIRTDSPT